MSNNLEYFNALHARINEFKQNSKNLKFINDFIDEILEMAAAEAISRNPQQIQAEPTHQSPVANVRGNRIAHRARGMIVRLFDAVINCAQSATMSSRGAQKKRNT